MSLKMLIFSGSPKSDGNTALLVKWFTKGALSKGAEVELVNAATLQHQKPGCISCRACQRSEKYECVINDEVSSALKKMIFADVIVMATPLYFFSASAQLKIVVDRMFSLYKWDNAAGTMQTPLKGKTFVLLGSAFEDIGLDALEEPFALTARYTSMKFKSLLIPNAGISGEITKISGVEKKAVAFGARLA